MNEVAVAPLPPDRFAELVGVSGAAAFTEALEGGRKVLDGRTLWQINSTGQGGGVAELLQGTLGYLLAGEIDVKWRVIEGDPEFFAITKRLHHRLHGEPGDGGPLGPEEKTTYTAALARSADQLLVELRPRDVVILHDPQSLGLAPHVARAGGCVIWTCHVGADRPNELTRQAWAFLQEFVANTTTQVFSRGAYVWDGLDPSRTRIIPPCIDAFAAKNRPMDAETVTAILAASGLRRATGAVRTADFIRRDDTRGQVQSQAELLEDQPVPPDAPLVLQVSRWDPLKDFLGVLRGFVEHVPECTGAHLVLAGPALDSVADDPEGRAMYDELAQHWSQLPPAQRARVHLARLPMADVEENGAMVGALQHASTVVTQKSLAEGFGLTVAEAMWKGRPTVASRVGGIQDQIETDVSGVLLDDPRDLVAFGAAVTDLLGADGRCQQIAQAARERVLAEYLAPTYLARQLDLVGAVAN